MMYSPGKHSKGMTLIETAVSIIILSIVIIGVSFFFVYGTNQIQLRNNYRVATLLASQKIEELKAGDYSDITEGASTEDITLADIAYKRTVNIQTFANFKRVDAKIEWTRMNKDCEISINTLIAP